MYKKVDYDRMGHTDRIPLVGSTTSRNSHSKATKKKKRDKSLGCSPLILFILVLGLLGITTFLFLYHPYFRVDSIEVTGNTKNTTDEILSASQLSTGVNIIKVNKDEVIAAIKNLPSIYSVVVQKKLPNKIIISVKEDYNFAYLVKDGNNYFVDPYGVITNISTDPPAEPIILLTGLVGVNDQVGEPITVSEEDIAFLKALAKENFTGNIVSCDMSKSSNITFVMNNNILVSFGKTSDLENKFLMLEQILIDIERKNIKTKEIMMNVGKNPVIIKDENENVKPDETRPKDSNNQQKPTAQP